MSRPDIVTRGDAPLIVSIPHSGIAIPAAMEARYVSLRLARRDADWWVHRLYDFAPTLGVTVVRTEFSRSVIDVNRDPSGQSLYPGQNTTELCPTTTFDGEPLYRPGEAPDDAEIAARRTAYFEPYHGAIAGEIARLRQRYRTVVLFDAHSIRSRIPRLFDGELPNFNIGSNSGASCDAMLTATVEAVCASTKFSRVTNGRFKGGWTARHYGKPQDGVHAIQLELACRGYMDEPNHVSPDNWPTLYDDARAGDMRRALKRILEACLQFTSLP